MGPVGTSSATAVSAPTAPVLPLIAAFTGIKFVQPDYAHPQHDHHDLVATASADFLALAVVVVAALQRVRRRETGTPVISSVAVEENDGQD